MYVLITVQNRSLGNHILLKLDMRISFRRKTILYNIPLHIFIISLLGIGNEARGSDSGGDRERSEGGECRESAPPQPFLSLTF